MKDFTRVVGGLRCLVEKLLTDPVHAIGVGGVGAAVYVLFHQHFHVLPVHVIDVLDEFIPAVQHCACGDDETDQFLLRGAVLAAYLQPDADAIVVAVITTFIAEWEEVLSLLNTQAKNFYGSQMAISHMGINPRPSSDYSFI